MDKNERIEKLTAALEWALGGGVSGYLDSLGHPSYVVQDAEGEPREVEPTSYLEPTLDACVRQGQVNGMSVLSPRPPIDPSREAVFDARIAMQDKVIANLNTQLDATHYAMNERNAYQNMLIRLIVMGASTTISEDDWRGFIHKCGDILIHWSKKPDS